MLKDNEITKRSRELLGNGVPHERHGEMGILYCPRIQLDMQELMLFAKAEIVLGRMARKQRRDFGRDIVVKIVGMVALDRGDSDSMKDSVIAFFDELYFAPTRTAQ